MSSAPVLKLIDGGKTEAAEAATPRAANKDMFLYPAVELGSGGAFGKIFALSLMAHGAVIVVALGLNMFSGDQGVSTDQEAIALDGINVILFDAIPNVPSPPAEVQQTDVADIKEPGIREEAAAPKTQAVMEVPADRLSPTPEETAIEPTAEEVSKSESEIAAGPALIEAELIEKDTAPKELGEAPHETTAEPLPKTVTPIVGSNPAPRPPPKSNAGSSGQKAAVLGKAGLSKYQSKIAAHLRRYRKYPDAARRKRITGTAIVSFTIDRRGRLIGASLAKRTGHAILDREALAMVRRASPFPAIPSGLGKSRVTLRVPVRYDGR